ncbi:MAG: flagellar hook protein FlgE [Pseudomonadota bacterium]|jgi:flagellar hook protein FlgE|nr:flagellar hook protein FlgE [Rubrivivax sp.]MCA3257842.1 flagellar hook protein FlgE [Rubrivivax sp.]MCE2911685.1 flagellar hook protein FlgE [Rubrivivax sp.]MCZ8030534.1 flagellar hook protein FlgE [Rubrivivax sp.]
MSFQQGISGLNATSKNLEVIGNNIANANTFGAKVARAEFGDVYAAALNGTGATMAGIGTNLTVVAQQFTQGNITTTENPLDLAINGNGFFQLSDALTPVTYTRNGQFKVDRDGFIVSNAGRKLMGYAADASGVIQTGQSAPLQLPTAGIAPVPTSAIDIDMNLDSRKAVTFTGATPAIEFDDAATYNNATSATVFDAKGQEIALTLFFQKSANDTWHVYATANGTTVAGTAAAPQPVTTITYAPDGKAPTSPTAPVVFDIPSVLNAQGATTLPIIGATIDLRQTTQYGSPFAVSNLSQDGFGAGQLASIVVEPNGIVTARYSNGQSRPAGQIEVANFRNPQGLQPLGDNQWGRTFSSGDPVAGIPGDGNLGVLQSGALEQSNVDITAELVDLITAQRVYQANAQTIKTQDQVMQTLVNLR